MEELKKEIDALRTRVEDKEHDLLIIQQELNLLRAKLDDAIAEKRVEELNEEEEARIRRLTKSQAEKAGAAAEKEVKSEAQNEIAQEGSGEVDIDEPSELEIPLVEEAQHEAIMRTINELSKTLDVSKPENSFMAKPTLGDRVSKQKLNDIKRGIGINERFLFANELFGGDMNAFSKAVDELNHVESETDANRLMDENLGIKYRWDAEDENVVAFKSLVSRRFSA